MADANGKTVEWLPEDMGEGVKDFFNEDDLIQKLHEKEIGIQAIKESLEKGKTENEMLQLILDKIEALDRKINHIFDGHVLIDGQFKKIKP